MDKHGTYEHFHSKYHFYKYHQRHPGMLWKAVLKLVFDKLVSWCAPAWKWIRIVFSKGIKVKLFLRTPRRNMGSGSINPFILNLDIRWKLMVNSLPGRFTARERSFWIQAFALLWCYTAYLGSCLATFRYATINTGCIISQESEGLNYTVADAWNLA
jgi:hypothetical protein